MISSKTLTKVFAFSLALSATACGGGAAVTQVTGPGIVRCQAALNEPPTTVPPDGATVSTTVSAARECSWTAATEASWISVSPSSGQGEGTLTIRVAENNVAAVRNGAIVLNDVRVTLAQEPAPCRFELSTSGTTVAHTGGSVSVNLATVTGCTWSAASDTPWLRVLTPSGSGSATVSFAIDPNSGSTRTADALVAGRRFAVTQEGPPPALPPPPPATPTPPGTPPPTAPPPTAPPPTNTPPPGPGTPAPPPTAPLPTPPNTPTPPPTNTPPPAPTPPPPPTNTSPPAPTPPTNTPPPAPTPPPPPSNTPQPGDPFVGTGTVSGLSGECPTLTFTLNGLTITTNGSTSFQGGACPSMRDGRTVTVRGSYTSSGAVLAEIVERQE